MYIKRLIEEKILHKLKLVGGVLLEGSRDVGKTETANKICKSMIKLDTEHIERIEIDSSLLTEGEKPRLIDEWQVYPKSFNIVRANIDTVKKPNLFLLTGSTTPGNESSLIHTGAGRIVKLKMYTLTLQEKSLTTNKIHFNDLFENKIQTSTNDKDIKFYLDEICKGDRPRLIDNTVEECIELNTDYVNSIVSANDRKNITNSTLQKILKELARNICTELNISSIAKNTNLSRETVTTYLDYLTDSNIIEFFYCWNTHLRSRALLRTSPKVNFTDQSLAIAILNASPQKLLDDIRTLGFMFESYVLKHLNVYCSLSDTKIYFYRDSDDCEIDCIIENKDNEWIGIEIKLGSENGIKTGIENLKKFYKKLSDEKQQLCKSLNIIYSGNQSFKVDEKINVISLIDLYI